MDSEKIKGIVEKFMSTTLKEFKLSQSRERPYIQCATDAQIAVEGLDEALAENMDYLDICALIEGVRGNEAYEHTNSANRHVDSKLFHVFTYRMIHRAIMESSASCIAVKLFMALRLEDFYEYLDSVRPDGELMLEYELVSGIINNVFCVVNCSGYRIMDALKLCREQMEKPWVPTGDDSIGVYERKIMEAYYLVGRILVKSFGFAFPERVDMEAVRSKYMLEGQE